MNNYQITEQEEKDRMNKERKPMYVKVDLKLRKLVNEISVSVATMLDGDEDLSCLGMKDLENLQDLVTELENKIDPIREKRWD
tara:strand:- start:4200 stop:4448 length:249 start_codon:yes stop_codon:yes gene_type:complete